MMVNLDNSSSAVENPTTSVGLGLEDLLHVNNNNNEIPEKTTTELTTVNPCNDNTTINLSNNQEQEARSTNIEKVGMNLIHDPCDSSVL